MDDRSSGMALVEIEPQLAITICENVGTFDVLSAHISGAGQTILIVGEDVIEATFEDFGAGKLLQGREVRGWGEAVQLHL